MENQYDHNYLSHRGRKHGAAGRSWRHYAQEVWGLSPMQCIQHEGKAKAARRHG